MMDSALRASMAVWNDYLKRIFTGPGDPNYAVCKITPYRIEYQGMGMALEEIWDHRSGTRMIEYYKDWA